MTIETSAGERLVDNVEAALSRAEDVIEQVRFDSLGEAILALNEMKASLAGIQSAPEQKNVPAADRERLLSRLSGVRTRLSRMNELLAGAALFYQGWAEQVTEPAGYAENGRWHGLSAVTQAARLRAEG